VVINLAGVGIRWIRMEQDLGALIRRAVETRERLAKTERAIIRVRRECEEHRRRLVAAGKQRRCSKEPVGGRR
jgi:phosphate uptake regulator